MPDKTKSIFFPNLSSQNLVQFLLEQDIDYEVTGPVNYFKGVAQLDRCKAHHLTWSKAINKTLDSTPAKVILLPIAQKVDCPEYPSKTLIFVKSPRETFRIIPEVFVQYDRIRDFLIQFNEISDRLDISVCHVSNEAQIGHNVIHPNVVITQT